MQSKPPKPKPGDEVMYSEDGSVMFVYREDGRRIDVDLAGEKNSENFEPDYENLVEGYPEPEIRELTEREIEGGVPEWLPEVESLVGELRGSTPGREDIDQIKINTIIALAGARYKGETYASVWERPDTCNINTYYQKWKRDPLFASVLDRVMDVIGSHSLREEVTSLAKARRMIVEAAPAAAEKHIELVKHPNPFVALQASGRILSMVEKSEDQGPRISITIKPAQLAILSREATDELDKWESKLLKPGN